jgi:hypothetical protein
VFSPPPFGSGGGTHSLAAEGVGGPNSHEGNSRPHETVVLFCKIVTTLLFIMPKHIYAILVVFRFSHFFSKETNFFKKAHYSQKKEVGG